MLMYFWRLLVRKARVERVPNERMRVVLKIKQKIQEHIEAQQVRWYRPVQKMLEERFPN